MKIIIRILTALVLVIGAFIAPWWAVALGMLLCIVAYRAFLEALAPAVVIDVLYGAHSIAGFVTIVTICGIIISIIAERYFRNHVRL